MSVFSAVKDIKSRITKTNHLFPQTSGKRTCKRHRVGGVLERIIIIMIIIHRVSAFWLRLSA